MEPAISHGDFVVIWKLAYGIPLHSNRYALRWSTPQHNDIVCYAIEGKYVIKRCVETGGSMLTFSVNQEKPSATYGFVHIMSKKVPLTVRQFKNLGGFLQPYTLSIPQNFILALGDNVQTSRDSRDYGFISVDSIRGKLLWK